MNLFYLFAVCVFAIGFPGCGKKAPSPVGTWTVRHEVVDEPVSSRGIEEARVIGFSTTTIAIEKDGAFFEFLVVNLFDDPDPDPVEFNGTWRQDAEVVRFKRKDADSTQSYVIDNQGVRMTGNVAGLDIVLTRHFDDNHTQ